MMSFKRKSTSAQYLTFAFMLMCCSSARGADGLECQEDYSPCTCVEGSFGRSVVCEEVLTDEIYQAFNRTESPRVYSVVLKLLPDDQHLPRNLLSGKASDRIVISGYDRDLFRLTADIGAFTSSKDYTQDLEVSDCNLADFDFGFLTGFDSLKAISLQHIAGVRSLRDLPNLPGVTQLYVSRSTGFRELTSFPARSFSALHSVELSYNDDFDEEVLSVILVALSSSPSQPLIRQFNFDGNRVLTRVPVRTSYFPNLDTVSMTLNSIQLFETGTVVFNGSKVAEFIAQNNSLAYVQPGAFVGDFSAGAIYLDNNDLTDFPADVYQSLLEQMEQANQGGYLSVQSNPFSCDCTLAWLIAYNQNLLSRVRGAKCGGSGKPFEQLDPNIYLNC